ncbi:amidohydrolase [Arachnia propionica]|uniref:Amidohydrolase n=1 Tax=Arachnia propionica TaxID=1750 RepID=A0A3P1TCX4_9ACTN|nr:amidohydrolase family protein [Arachnia propionica]RRD07138.1 amidohydrolase [Arachnia propionica]
MQSYRISRVRPVIGAWRDVLVDVTVTGGLIAAISPSTGRADGDLDADGSELWPGLWDHHVHFSTHALIGQALPLSPDASMAEVLATVRHAITPQTTHLIGFGFRSATWPDPPSAPALDEVTALPVALMSRDLHSLWCNTTGLALAGQPRHPTGFLVEEEAFAAIRHIMATRPDLVDEAVRTAEQEAAARGIVGIVDLEMDWAVSAWRRRAGQRTPALRVEAATYPEHLDDLLALGLPHGHEVAPGVRIGALKIIADGAMGSRTAHCTDPYPTPLPGLPHGRVNLAPEDLQELLARAHRAGLHAAVHAIGDAACHLVLNAFEVTGARGSVEHAQCVRHTDLPRFAALGVAASIQPQHQLDDAGVVERIWPTALNRAYPMLDLLRAGAALRLGSDAPVAPLDPWRTLEAACRRPFRTDQALPLEAALRASSRTDLEVGQTADLVIAARPGEVRWTMLGGRITHHSN